MACNGSWTSLVTSAIGESSYVGIGPTLYLSDQICRRHADVWSRPGHSSVHLPTSPWSLVNIMVMNGWLAYFRSMSIGRPISEIRLFQTFTWYSKVKVMGQRQGHAVGPVSYYFASFSFHINQTNTFSDAAISKFDIETSKVKVMNEVKGQGHIPSIQPILFLFVSHQPDQPFLRYHQKVFDLEKSHPKFSWKFPKITVFNRTSFTFCGDRINGSHFIVQTIKILLIDATAVTLGQCYEMVVQYISPDPYILCPKYLGFSSKGFDVRGKRQCGGGRGGNQLKT